MENTFNSSETTAIDQNLQYGSGYDNSSNWQPEKVGNMSSGAPTITGDIPAANRSLTPTDLVRHMSPEPNKVPSRGDVIPHPNARQSLSRPPWGTNQDVHVVSRPRVQQQPRENFVQSAYPPQARDYRRLESSDQIGLDGKPVYTPSRPAAGIVTPKNVEPVGAWRYQMQSTNQPAPVQVQRPEKKAVAFNREIDVPWATEKDRVPIRMRSNPVIQPTAPAPAAEKPSAGVGRPNMDTAETQYNKNRRRNNLSQISFS